MANTDTMPVDIDSESYLDADAVLADTAITQDRSPYEAAISAGDSDVETFCGYVKAKRGRPPKAKKNRKPSQSPKKVNREC
jgi:hypothetical protein